MSQGTRMDEQKKFFTCNGAQIFAQIKGAGETIVFVHGQALDHRMWRTQMDYFSKYYQCIALDMRGYGRSSRIHGEAYSMPDDLVHLLDQLSIDRFHLVGLSRGGRMAGDLVVTYPGRVKSLTLVDAHITGLPIHETYGAFKKIIRAAVKVSDEEAKNEWKNSAIFAPIMKIEKTRDEFLAMLDDFEPYFWKTPTTEKTPQPLPADRLHEITCPTLIIVGEHDVTHFQEVANVLKQKIPNSKYVKMNGVGHMANMENPSKFNSILQSFLQELK